MELQQRFRVAQQRLQTKCQRTREWKQKNLMYSEVAERAAGAELDRERKQCKKVIIKRSSSKALTTSEAIRTCHERTHNAKKIHQKR
eukprot:3445964-Amphidinium_carterae.1